MINEELQPQLVIAKLKKQVARLEEELHTQGRDELRDLTEEEKAGYALLPSPFHSFD